MTQKNLLHRLRGLKTIFEKKIIAAAIIVLMSSLVIAGEDTVSQEGEVHLLPAIKNIQTGPLRFDFGAQTRVRYERYDGYTLKEYGPGLEDDLLLARLRLDFSAALFGAPRFFLQLQDAQAFLTRYDDDDYPVSSPIEDSLDIRQAYVEWLKIGEGPLGFRAGRQQIAYGDQRVFGPGNWGNTGRYAWEAGMIKLDAGTLWADFWLGRYLLYKSDEWPNKAVDDFYTAVAYGGLKGDNLRFDVFYVYKSDEQGAAGHASKNESLRSHTAGFQSEMKIRKILDVSATGIIQRGEYGPDDIRAWGMNARAGVTAPAPWKPRLGVQFTLGSGDEDPNDNVHGTFDGVYGGRDIYFYGYLNLFTWANIRDYEINFSLEPLRNLRLVLDYHYFTLDESKDAWYTTGMKSRRRDETGRSGIALGHEIDVRIEVQLLTHFEIMAGFGRMIPGEFIRATGLSSPSNWGFVQTSLVL